MINTALQRLDRSTRRLVPFLTSVFLIVLSALPVNVPGYGQIAANLGLVTVFYWTIYRPDLFPALAAFAVGLWQDTLVGSPIGLHALILLLANWAIASQRTFFHGKAFSVIWWGFFIVALVAAVLSWIIACALYATLINPMPAVFQAFLTIGVFPFMAWLLARVQYSLIRPDGLNE